MKYGSTLTLVEMYATKFQGLLDFSIKQLLFRDFLTSQRYNRYVFAQSTLT